jgi:hypothetical protein
MGPSEKSQWVARFSEASRILYEATEGQLRFGHVFMADEGWGLGHAEFVLHDSPGTAYATHGEYGLLGRSVQLFANQTSGDARTIVHEFGHHAFGLGDEYTGPIQQDEIDTEATLSDGSLFTTVPLLPSENDSQSLKYGFAILQFAGRIERLIVDTHAPTLLTVFGGFSQDPTEADNGRIFYQPQYNYTNPIYPDGILIRCSDQAGSNYCLMERYSGDQSGTGNISEFCAAANHDPDHDTSHDDRHGGLSCWEVIGQVMQDRFGFALDVPNPAATGQQTDDVPLFLDLVKEARIALVMDRSGSMGQDNKIQGARYGVEQWITSAHADSDRLSVTWFNQEVETRLSSDVIDPAELDAVIDQVNDINPGGWTNIRDALYEAVNQIQSEDGRAAIQAIVLLTDGIHNRPTGTSVAETIPTLQEAGIPVYVIALGSPENVDYAALGELARETGGFINPLGMLQDANGNPLSPDEQLPWIQTHIFLTNHILRNGLVTVGNQEVAGAAPESDFGRAIAQTRGRPLPLRDVARLQGVDQVDSLLHRRRQRYSLSVPFLVERGATTLRFAIAYARKQKFQLNLIDPQGQAVNFADGSAAVQIAPDASPYATAIIRHPKPGLWHAVIVRTSTGAPTRVSYSAGVENRMIVVQADCDPRVAVGAPAAISAGALFGDRLSGLRVTAHLTAPDGSRHHVVLNDDTHDEPDSGDYQGTFTPKWPGRYSGEVCIRSTGRTVAAGGVHRVVHAPLEKRAAAVFDLNVKVPVFVRRIPIHLDAGPQPTLRDLDTPSKAWHVNAPLHRRTKGLKPPPVDEALARVKTTSPHHRQGPTAGG